MWRHKAVSIPDKLLREKEGRDVLYHNTVDVYNIVANSAQSIRNSCTVAFIFLVFESVGISPFGKEERQRVHIVVRGHIWAVLEHGSEGLGPSSH